MITRAELRQALTTIPHVEEVTVSGDPHFGDLRLVATVVSSSFHDLNEAERQATVWGCLYERFGNDGLKNVEFIFTNTPEENAAIQDSDRQPAA